MKQLRFCGSMRMEAASGLWHHAWGPAQQEGTVGTGVSGLEHGKGSLGMEAWGRERSDGSLEMGVWGREHLDWSVGMASWGLYQHEVHGRVGTIFFLLFLISSHNLFFQLQ